MSEKAENQAVVSAIDLIKPNPWNLLNRFFVNKEETMAEEVVLPIYEMLINTAEPHDQTKPTETAQADIGDGIHFKCSVSGQVHDEPNLSWVYNGQAVIETESHKIQTDSETLITNLKIQQFALEDTGIYECTVKRRDANTHKAKMRLQPKPKAYNGSSFGESLCTGKLAESFCRNGGTCLVHTDMNVLSCQCTTEWQGSRCERSYLGVDRATVAVPTFLPVKEIDRASMIAMGAVMSGLFCALIVCLFLFIHQKKQIKGYRRRQSSDSPQKKYLFSDNDQMENYVQRCLTCPNCKAKLPDVETMVQPIQESELAAYENESNHIHQPRSASLPTSDAMRPDFDWHCDSCVEELRGKYPKDMASLVNQQVQQHDGYPQKDTQRRPSRSRLLAVSNDPDEETRHFRSHPPSPTLDTKFPNHTHTHIPMVDELQS